MRKFVAFDIELADNNPTSICEIAFVRFDGEKEPQVARALIQPLSGPSVGSMQFMIHGISEKDLIGKPHLGEVWGQFENFIGELPLVGHNATQDIKKLLATLEEQGCELRDTTYFDTLTLARNTPELVAEEDYSLEQLALQFDIDWFEINRDSGGLGHSAAIDAASCGQLFVKIMGFHNGQIDEMLTNLNMKPGLIRDSQVVNGNVKIKSNDYFASMTSYSSKQFDEIRDSLLDEGLTILDDHEFTGKNFVLTLWFEGWTELQIWQAVALSGGQLKTSVTKKVHFLLEGDDPSGKYTKGETSKSRAARDLNNTVGTEIRILSQQDFEIALGSELVATVFGLES